MKFNVHAGHNMKAAGASSYLNEVTEDRKIKDRVISYLRAAGHTVYDCTDDSGKTPGACLKNIVEKCSRHEVDLDVSIHLNASKKDSGDGKVKGTEVFIYSTKSRAKGAAERICRKMAALGFTNRGVKTSTSLYVLKNTKSPALLIEVCFVDDKDDYNLYKKVGVDKISQAIAEGLINAAVPGGGSIPDVSDKVSLKASDLKNMGVADIIKKVGALFTDDQKRSGILASVSLAQFILESDYGRSELAQVANNCFGMKRSLSGNTWPGSAWDGKSVYKKTTKEHVNGKYITVTAEFRKYPDIAKSIADHSAYLLGAMNGKKKRYAGLEGETSYKKAITIIKNGGYATSPDYIGKICGLIEKYNLTRYDVSSGGISAGSVSSSGNSAGKEPTSDTAGYYKKYTGKSIHINDVFKAVGVPEKFRGGYMKRKLVASRNGISNYKGTKSQNLKLIALAQKGKLKKV